MLDRPDGRELLQETLRTLAEELAPRLSGDARFKALMAANALGMALRELKQGAEVEKAQQALQAFDRDVARAIRRGDHDAAAALHLLLLAETRARVAISNPKAMQEAPKG